MENIRGKTSGKVKVSKV